MVSLPISNISHQSINILTFNDHNFNMSNESYSFQDVNQNELIADFAIERRINYKDIDYSECADISETRRRVDILKKMGKGETRVKYWNKLQCVRKDSTGCFIEMMKNYHKYEFQFHNLTKIEKVKGEGKGEEEEQNEEQHHLNKYNWVYRKLCINERHRVEMLPYNIDLKELVEDLNEMRKENNVEIIFNIGGNNQLLNNFLYHIRNLVWLNIGESKLNNIKFQSLIQVINRGGLNNLTGLVITNNVQLCKEKLIQDLKKLNKGKLQYLEGNFEVERITTNNNGHDSIIEEIEVGLDFKLMNDGKKYEYLKKKGIIKVDNENVENNNNNNNNNKVLIDFGVCHRFEWGDRVKLGLSHSHKGRSYKVKVNLEESIRRERVLSEKIERAMMRISEEEPVVKKVKKSGGGSLLFDISGQKNRNTTKKRRIKY